MVFNIGGIGKLRFRLMNLTDEADQLLPRLAMRAGVFSGIDGGELPFVVAGKRVDGLRQIRDERFELFRGALRSAGLPKIGAKVQVFHAKTVAFADGRIEIFRPRKVVHFRKRTGERGFVFRRQGNIGAIEVGEFRGGKRQGSDRRNRPGNPAVKFLFLSDFARGVGGRPMFPGKSNIAIFIVAGFGVGVQGDRKTAGKLRAVTLVATDRPSSQQLSLIDPQKLGESAGLGVCNGDSGGPVFDERDRALVGIVSWSARTDGEPVCGFVSGVIPLARYHYWILETAARLGSPLEP